MKKLNCLFGAFLLICLPIVSLGQGDIKSSAEMEVTRSVQTYLDAKKNNDFSKFQNSVSPNAVIFSTSGQDCPKHISYQPISGKQFLANYKRVSRRPEPFPFTSKIVSISLTQDTAAVKVESYWSDAWWGCGKISPLSPPPGITDSEYLTLVRFDDGWKIVSIASSSREGK